MASTLTGAFAILAVVLAVAAHSARGAQLSCEELPPDVCAFAVSSGGRRCVLERTPEGARRCQTSSAVGGARGLAAAAGWVETDACVRACGADRAALGLPVVSAAAEDRRTLRALCSPACRDACPNVVDLYATLAAAEGMSLPALCEAQKNAGNRRMMMAGMAPVVAPVAPPVVAPPVAPPVVAPPVVAPPVAPPVVAPPVAPPVVAPPAAPPVAAAPPCEPPVVAPPPCDDW